MEDEPVDGFLVAAEDESDERTSRFLHPHHRLVEKLVSQDRQDWTICGIDPFIPNEIVIFEQTHVSDPDLGAPVPPRQSRIDR
jgi:hypothetical protein